MTYQTGGTGTEEKDAGAHLGSDLVETVSGAGGRLQQGGIDVGEVLDLEDTASYSLVRSGRPCREARQLTRIGAVLGKTAVHGDTVGFEMLAHQFLTTAAVKALAAKLRVVCNNAVSELEALHLGASGSNDTDSLVA